MSISNQTELVINPANKRFNWKGSGEENEGNFLEVYNTITKTSSQVNEVTFIILDQLTCISGYSSKTENSIWSNEVHNTTKEVLKVETKDKNQKNIILKEGLYQDIKEVAVANGGKYTKVLYALELDKNNNPVSPIPIRVYLSGSSFGAFIDMNAQSGNIIKISNKGVFSPKSKGKVAFYPPKIEIISSSLAPKELNTIAVEVDVLLQTYFKKKNKIEDFDEQETSEQPQPQHIQTHYEPDTQELPDLSMFDVKPTMPF